MSDVDESMPRVGSHCKLSRRDSQQFYEDEAPVKPVVKVKEFEFAVINGRPCRVRCCSVAIICYFVPNSKHKFQVIEKNKLGSERWQIVARDLFLWDSIDEVLTTEDIVPDPLLTKEEYIVSL